MSGVPDLARVRFSLKEFRRTAAIEDPAVLVREPLATELEFSTVILGTSDATTFGQQILDLRKESRNTWTMDVLRGSISCVLGDTITVVYPRFGLAAGKNFIVKGLRIDGGVFDTLTLFGPQ